jgi:PKD repeat protein
MRAWIVSALVSVVLVPASASESGGKPKRPELRLRAVPTTALAPAYVQFTVKIDGGSDLEDYHCPQIIWDWDDGTHSVEESDCSPYEPGTEIVRRFSARHAYRASGIYTVSVTLRRASRSVASARTAIDVHSR